MNLMEFMSGRRALHTQDIESVCKDFTEGIVSIVQRVKAENERLKKENQELKEEHYKDNEIQRLLKENQSLKEESRRGFKLSEEEEEMIKEWCEDHVKFNHRGKRSGAIGGRFTYNFTPTSIGTCGDITCSCGTTYRFRDI